MTRTALTVLGISKKKKKSTVRFDFSVHIYPMYVHAAAKEKEQYCRYIEVSLALATI